MNLSIRKYISSLFDLAALLLFVSTTSSSSLAGAPDNKIQIGWELTFFNTRLVILDPQGNSYPDRILSYFEKLRERYSVVSRDVASEMTIGDMQKDKWGDPSFKLSFHRDGKSVDVLVTLDPNVVEIALPPLTQADIVFWSGHFDKYLFKFLKNEVNASPTTLLGSGHMNVGVKSAFGDTKDTARKVANWTTLIWSHPALARGILEMDPYNAQKLTEGEQLTAYRKILAKVADAKIPKVTEFAKLIDRDIYSDLESTLGVTKEKIVTDLTAIITTQNPEIPGYLSKLGFDGLATINDVKRRQIGAFLHVLATDPEFQLMDLIVAIRRDILDNFYHWDHYLRPTRHMALRFQSFDPLFTGTTELTPAARIEFRSNNAPTDIEEMLLETEMLVGSINQSNKLSGLIDPPSRILLNLSDAQKVAQFYYFLKFSLPDQDTKQVYNRFRKYLPLSLRGRNPWEDPNIDDLKWVYESEAGNCWRILQTALSNSHYESILGISGLAARLTNYRH